MQWNSNVSTFDPNRAQMSNCQFSPSLVTCDYFGPVAGFHDIWQLAQLNQVACLLGVFCLSAMKMFAVHLLVFYVRVFYLVMLNDESHFM